ncbi:hypothetical protein GCM10007898_14780 [Dyella flagellata]|uniref:Carrier domain-containing protein n=1 Tax=Dyella flagellata TaxID=1867833 RepID=A0ABQ5X8C8_9GAMM|nr:hypothetical protein GCM10007898_14780 [Dyella flagellata]
MQLRRAGLLPALQARLRLHGIVDVDALAHAWARQADAHPILSVALLGVAEQDGGWQAPGSSRPSFRHEASEHNETQLYLVAEQERELIETDAPRARLAVLAANASSTDHWVVITVAPECCDARSLYLLVGALLDVTGQGGLPHKSEALDYFQYAEWQFSVMREPEARELADYWAVQGHGVDLLSFMPACDTRRAHSPRIAVRLKLPDEMVRCLRALSARLGVRISSIAMTSVLGLLQRLTDAEDFTLGFVFDGRSLNELQTVVGPLSQTLPISLRAAPADTVQSLIARVDATLGDAAERQDFVDWEVLAKAAGDPSMMLPFCLEWLDCRGMEQWEEIALQGGDASYEVKLRLIESANGIEAEWTYAPHRRDLAAVAHLGEQWQSALAACLAAPSDSLGALQLLGESERRQLLDEFAGQPLTLKQPASVMALIAQQAAQRPDAIALRGEHGVLSYAMLQRQALGYAAAMRAQGDAGIIGIDARFAAETIVLMLAAMWAGLAYVPIDMEQPTERLAAVWTATDAPLPIFGIREQPRMTENLPQLRYVRLAAAPPPIACPPPLAGQQLAYVILTSGSTGTPKGVSVSHQSLLQSTAARLAYYREPVRCFVLLSPLYVDSSVAGIYWTLASGGELVVPAEETRRDARRIQVLLESVQASHLLCIPSLYKLVLEEVQRAGHAIALTAAIVAAEPCQRDLVTRHADALAQAGLYNEYGPSEATVWASVFDCRILRQRRVPIGIPAPHSRLYVLDDAGEPVLVGEAGEICIGGALASGYWRNPKETARRFVPDKFGTTPGAVMYRSGDYGWWCADGSLMFAGRRDEQVKILGYRVELAEVRQAIETHPQVREACVRHDPDHAQIVAYVVWHGDSDAAAALQPHLQRLLPRFMLPHQYVVLERLPRLPGGKIDVQQLPIVEHTPAGFARNDVPEDPLETLVAAIWSQCLPKARVHRLANFFAIGGNSLNGIQVISRVQDALQSSRVGIRELFNHPVLAGFAAELRRLQLAPAGVDTDFAAEEPLSAQLESGGDEAAPASFFQERLYFLQAADPDSTAYNCPFAIQLEGTLDVARLEAALHRLVQRHAALRTRLRMQAGALRQFVDNALPFQLKRKDLSGTDTRPSTVAALLLEVGSQPFQLEHDLPFRACLFTLAQDRHLLVLVVHHAVFDGWSLRRLVTDVRQLYSDPPAAPEPAAAANFAYADYARWQSRQWQRGVWQGQLDYWRRQLEGATGVLALPTDHPRSAQQRFTGQTLHFQWSSILSKSVRRECHECGITAFMFFEALFALLLQRYSGQNDILIGTPVANRGRLETEALVGPVANTVVIRNTLMAGESWRDFLARMRNVVVNAYCHQDVPFEKLVEALNPARSLAHSPLFQVMLVMQNLPLAAFELDDLRCTLIPHQSRSAKFDMTLSLFETEAAFHGQLEYNSSLFEHATIERLLENLEWMAHAVLAHPHVPLRQLDMLSVAECDSLRALNPPPSQPSSETLLSLFNAQVARSPDAVAVRFEGTALTYAMLDRQANQLAHYLIARGVAMETPVALILARSPELMISLLGILKAGCAYMPLDSESPPAYLERLWTRAGNPYVITDQPHDRHDFLGDKEVSWARDASAIFAASQAAPQRPVWPEQMAYVIHTSGSTGEPKAVAVPHAGIVNRLQWMQQLLQLRQGEAVLQKTPYTFDVSVWELFWPLLQGACVVLASPGQHRDPAALEQLLAQERVAFVHFVPAMLSTFLQARGFERLDALRAVVCSGEALDASLCERFFGQADSVALYNMYGPTEASIDVSSWVCRRGDATVPIGHPIDGMALHVSGVDLALVPRGAVGELLIGGIGLARGYRGNPKATAAAFIPDAQGGVEGARLYRTGDLARHRADGAVEFLGRRDQQIKLRGFRIELGEIEHVLLQFRSITQAAALVQDSATPDARLLAYVAGIEAGQLPEVKRYLASQLPPYMLPARIVVLDGLPVLNSGKVDRGALMRHPLEPVQQRGPFTPRNATEQKLGALFMHHLRTDSIDGDADFFSAGGHSLAAIALLSDINTEFRISMSLQWLLESSSFTDLATRIDGLRYLQSTDVRVAHPNAQREIEGYL